LLKDYIAKLFETKDYKRVNPELSDWNQNDVENFESETSYTLSSENHQQEIKKKEIIAVKEEEEKDSNDLLGNDSSFESKESFFYTV